MTTMDQWQNIRLKENEKTTSPQSECFTSHRTPRSLVITGTSEAIVPYFSHLSWFMHLLEWTCDQSPYLSLGSTSPNRATVASTRVLFSCLLVAVFELRLESAPSTGASSGAKVGAAPIALGYKPYFITSANYDGLSKIHRG